MTKPGKSDWWRLGCAAVLTAAIAFPAGMMFSRQGPEASPSPANAGQMPAPSDAKVRNIYSVKVLDDPYFLAQQQRLVEALETSCRTSGEHCAEARLTRPRIDELAKDARR